MINVQLIASSPIARAGLRAMLAEDLEFEIAGAEQAGADVVLWELPHGQDPGGRLQLPTVLLTDRPARDLLRAGARGVLPPAASAEQISAALRAVAANLVVTFPERPAEDIVTGTLSAREREVLKLIGDGHANKEIAYRLGISEHTVKFHVSALLGKLGVSTRAEAIRVGIRQGAILV